MVTDTHNYQNYLHKVTHASIRYRDVTANETVASLMAEVYSLSFWNIITTELAELRSICFCIEFE